MRKLAGPVLLSVLAAACATAPAPEHPEGWDPFLTVPEVLPPHLMTFVCDEDPGRPARTLDLWLDLLGFRAVRERGEGVARLYGFFRNDREDDYLVRWRRQDDGLAVQVTHAGGFEGNFSRRSLASLAFVMRAKGIDVVPAPSSACLLPKKVRPGAPKLLGAMTLEFQSRGQLLSDAQVGQGCFSTSYGPPGGPSEWHVDIEGLDGGDPSIEVVHDAVPFDAETEQAVLLGILKRMGITGFGF